MDLLRFQDGIAIVSLQSSAILAFTRGDELVDVQLDRGDLLLLEGEARCASACRSSLGYGDRARAWQLHPDTAEISSLRRAGQGICAALSMALLVGCACLSQIRHAIACIDLQKCMGTLGPCAHVRGAACADTNGCMASLLSLGYSCESQLRSFGQGFQSP